MSNNPTGYGPSPTNQWQSLIFNGDERRFEVWQTKILAYLKLKKLKETVVGTAAVNQDKNETAFAEIIQFLDDRSLSLIMTEAKDDGRKAFRILREFYAGNSKPRIITLYNELTTLSKLTNETVTDYMIRAEKTAIALKSAEENISDALLIAMVLKGLPDDYKAFVAIVTQSEKMDTFQKFKQSLRNFDETEKTRNTKELSGATVSDSVMKVIKSPKQIICYNCGIAGHKAPQCKKKWCNNCKSSTHNTKSCRKKTNRGDQAHKTKDFSTNNDNDHHTSYAFKLSDKPTLNTSTHDKFLVDCGATAHIVTNEENFIYVNPDFVPEQHYIELANGSKSTNVVLKKGTVVVDLRTSSGEIVKVELEDTLYIPSYPQNIFSVNAAIRKGATLIISQNQSELIAPNGTKFDVHEQSRLYYLYKITDGKEKRIENLESWHRLLGHCNTSDIKKLENVVQGMKINGIENFDCETCTMAKQTNSRSREPDIRATKPFELVHTDLARPIESIAKGGFKYVMIFTDDYSGCNFTYFLKEKSGASRATEKFLSDIAPYGKVKKINFTEDVFPTGEVKRMRSDNGGEYISREFKDILIKHSIKHELSAPYSPHQNGTAERNWRTLFDMGRALLIESGLPKSLWTYAVMTATHVRNRCYVKKIKETPYGLITGVKPNLKNLHMFGTICYPYVHTHKKLEPRSRFAYFVGYDKESPAYLVYNPDTQSVSKHRIVKFTEKFHTDQNDDGAINGSPQPETSKTEAGTDRTSEDIPEAQITHETTGPSRYPTRDRKPPQYFADYQSYCDDDEQYDYCYAALNLPLTYEQATNGPDAEKWQQAMDDEMNSLIENDTFTVTELPESKSVVGGKWVYTIKGEPMNPLFKARYVAKGYSQTKGVDFLETFSPTARMESVRMLTQIAVQENWPLHQMDVKGAYLHAPIEHEVYVNEPEGYRNNGNVWKLKKSLYGLKQSGRNWHNMLHSYLKDINFVQSSADPCVFIQSEENNVTILVVWVDDLIITSSLKELLNDLKKKLNEQFKMKDLEEISSFLGIEFKRDTDSITMSQSKYLQKLLHRFGYIDSRPRSTPCEPNPNAYHDDISEESNETDIREYRQMVGSLVYAMTSTRPDLSYCITKLSQHLAKPQKGDWIMLKHVFRYIKQTIDYGLTYRKSESDLKLLAYCDADWGAAVEDRRSISGYCISLTESGPPISWKSRKQTSVALSTCEAEYMSISITCQEIIYLTQLLRDIEPSREPIPAIIRNDNQGAIALVKNPVKHTRSKHIDIRYHFIRDCYNENKVTLEYVPTNMNISDLFTKPPKRDTLKLFHKFLFGQ